MDDREVDLDAGATVVIPGGVHRRITAGPEFTAMVAGYGTATVRVPGNDEPSTPPWIS